MLKMIAKLFAPKTVETKTVQTIVVDSRTHSMLQSLGSLVPFSWISSYAGDGCYTLHVQDAEEVRLYLTRFNKSEESATPTNTRTWWKVTVTTTRWDRYQGKDVATVTHEKEHHASHLAHIEAGKIRETCYRNYWFHTQPRYQGDQNLWVGSHHNDKVRIEITEIQKSY